MQCPVQSLTSAHVKNRERSPIIVINRWTNYYIEN
jgi:hypothetical protein